MTDRERLIKLIEERTPIFAQSAENLADYLLENGIIVAPMPMADWLRKELTEHVYQRCMDEL